MANSRPPLKAPPNAQVLTARDEDARLVGRMVGGDATAWRTFVERFDRLVLTRVMTVARELNRSLNQDDAEDLCADIFSQLVAGDFAALRRFEGRSTLSTWLCVVTRRIVLRRLSAHRGPASQLAPALGSLSGPASDDPQRLAICDEERALLASGIAQLNERQRRLAYLFYVDGCSYHDISEQLQMPMNSVGPTLARIHEKLRAVMKTED